MYKIRNEPDTGFVLSTLAGIIRDFSGPVDQYMRQIGEREILNPFQSNAQTGLMSLSETAPGGFWERLGIRRLTVDPFRYSSAIKEPWYDDNMTLSRWNRIKDETLVKELSGIFGNSPVIEFADWAGADNASGCWDGLYTDVIKSLDKRDLHFIFHLGDVAKKLVFEIDEILDIIGDYSLRGKVTLMLDDYEADNLWSRLNGQNPETFTTGFGSPEARERYQSLFNTMNIGVLLVLNGNRVILFSRDGQFDLASRPPAGIREVVNTRGRFSVGYQMGLLLQLEIPDCIALGLAVSGGYPESVSGTGSALLLDYIQNWANIFK